MEREREDDGKGVVGAAGDGDGVAGVAGNDAADGDDAAAVAAEPTAELTAEPPMLSLASVQRLWLLSVNESAAILLFPSGTSSPVFALSPKQQPL
ncbi:hypothetical protein MY3296_005247 [Beauveria thailandica]